MKNKIDIAIWMVTYNHEDYIQQAIESIMMQQTNFHYKLFIGEDYSSDNTRKICDALKKKYPKKIELLVLNQNIGPNKNASQIYNACFDSEAKYIAMCEGDDYWTDPLKLQKQVDAMEANEKISLVYTNCKITFEDGRLPSRIRYSSLMPEGKCLEKVIDGNFPQTLSILFRTSFLPNGISKITKLKYAMGDYPLFLYLSLVGEYKYLPDVTCVYRRNSNSIMESNLLDYKKQLKFIDSSREVLIDFLKEQIINDPNVIKKIKNKINTWLLIPFSMSLQHNDLQLAQEYWTKIKINKEPIPFKYKLLHFSTFLGPLGKLLIKIYYKK